MSDSVKLSIIIPAYKEEANISSTLVSVSEYLGKNDLSCEVIVVDDGSTDSTVSKALDFRGKLPNFRVIESKPNRGKGYVLKKAMLEAEGEWLMFMDADSSVLVSELDNFLPALTEEYDIYIASRRIPGSDVDMPLKRELFGKIYIALARVVLGLKVSDINCGFKLFSRRAARDAFSRQTMNDWSYDAEVLHIANKAGYKIKEIPVKWVYKDTSKVSPLRDGIKSFWSLLRIKSNELSGKYRGS